MAAREKRGYRQPQQEQQEQQAQQERQRMQDDEVHRRPMAPVKRHRQPTAVQQSAERQHEAIFGPVLKSYSAKVKDLKLHKILQKLKVGLLSEGGPLYPLAEFWTYGLSLVAGFNGENSGQEPGTGFITNKCLTPVYEEYDGEAISVQLQYRQMMALKAVMPQLTPQIEQAFCHMILSAQKAGYYDPTTRYMGDDRDLLQIAQELDPHFSVERIQHEGSLPLQSKPIRDTLLQMIGIVAHVERVSQYRYARSLYAHTYHIASLTSGLYPSKLAKYLQHMDLSIIYFFCPLDESVDSLQLCLQQLLPIDAMIKFDRRLEEEDRTELRGYINSYLAKQLFI